MNHCNDPAKQVFAMRLNEQTIAECFLLGAVRCEWFVRLFF
jgi:hypothetical protein